LFVALQIPDIRDKSYSMDVVVRCKTVNESKGKRTQL